MTREAIKAVLERVLTWPKERQEEAAAILLLLEAQDGESYDPDDEEWAAVQEGLAEAQRGEFVPDEEIEALWNRYGR